MISCITAQATKPIREESTRLRAKQEPQWSWWSPLCLLSLGSERMQNRWVRVRRKREANDTLRFVALTSEVGGVVNRGRHNWKNKTHVLSGTDPLHSQPYLLLTSNTSNWKRQLICLFLFSTSRRCLFTPLGSMLCMNRSIMYVYTTGSRFNTYPFVRFRIWHRFLVLPI